MTKKRHKIYTKLMLGLFVIVGMALTWYLCFLIIQGLFRGNIPDNSNSSPPTKSSNMAKMVEVEVGQTWVGVDTFNPYEPARYDTIVVLEIKRKFSKVIWNGRTMSTLTSNINDDHRHLLK